MAANIISATANSPREVARNGHTLPVNLLAISFALIVMHCRMVGFSKILASERFIRSRKRASEAGTEGQTRKRQCSPANQARQTRTDNRKLKLGMQVSAD